MESLISALIGWVETADEILNLQTGMSIRNTSDNLTERVEVVFPSGDVQEFEGDSAARILDRAEALAKAASAMNEQLNKLVAGAL